jgi:endonuclease/exonuclease/phosphatase family metal-dependent hydrolase
MILRLSAAVLCALAMSTAAFAQTLPSGWATADIGAVGAVGSASGGSGAFTADGAGADVWGTSDAFRFTYTTLTGDGSVVTRVTSAEAVNDWTKTGVMMRETLATGARHAFMLVSARKGLAFQRRTTSAGLSSHTTGGAGTVPYFVKLTRAGSTFTAYKSTDGVAWSQVASDTIGMGSTIYVGVAVSSHVSGVLATSTFASTSVSPVAPPPPPPPSTLRLLQWNTQHGGKGSDGRYDPVRLANWIAQMTPDVASLNEVDTQDQVNAIVSALQARTGVTWNVSFSGLGNLVLSRLPLTAKSNCLYGMRSDGGGAYSAHASVLVSGRAVNIWSTHLNVSSASSRRTEIAAVQACAANWPEARIIAGDFNMQYGSPEYFDAARGYTDAWLKAKALGVWTNFPGNCDGCTRNSRIDYVFTSNGATNLVLKSAQIYDTRDANGVTASDHKPMVVTYTVN